MRSIIASAGPKARRARSSRRIGVKTRFLPSRYAVAAHAIEWYTGFLLSACIVFGGATRSGSLGDVILQFLSVALLVAAARKVVISGASRRLSGPLTFVGLIILIPTMQLVPLPLSVWRLLPGRDLISETYALIGQPQPWAPITLTPDATWLSALSLLPPVAIFMGVLTLDFPARRRLSHVFIAAAVLSVFLGLLQLAQGPHSWLRFYEITNTSEAVGFFANRNHFAALLYVSTLLIAAHFFEAVIAAARKANHTRIDFNRIVPLIAWLTTLVIVIAGVMMARSRAGLSLTALALCSAQGFGAGDMRVRTLRPGAGKAILALTATVVIFFAPLAFYRILDRLGSDPSADIRVSFARNTISAATAFMPFGSGVGSFVPVYQHFERTPDIGLSYANHAHNDLLELWLETGVPGIALLAAFCVWFIRRCLVVWGDTDRRDAGIDLSLQRACTLGVFFLLAHSLADYPLRTTTMLAVAATAIGLLIAPMAQTSARSASGGPKLKA